MQRSESKTARGMVGYPQRLKGIAANKVNEDFKAVDMTGCPSWLPKEDALIPDSDDPDHPAWNYPAWFVPEELPYPEGSYKAENHSLGDGTLGDQDQWVYSAPISPRLPGRAAQHSLSDPYRDSWWRGFSRRAKRFIRNVWRGFKNQ
jgi:hypothetical protein